MSDFHQASVITTLHKLGAPNLESLEADLDQITAARPVALVLPCLFAELETAAMPRIAEELLQVGYLREIVVALAMPMRSSSPRPGSSSARSPRRPR